MRTFLSIKYGNQLRRIVGTFGKRLTISPTSNLVGDLPRADSQLYHFACSNLLDVPLQLLTGDSLIGRCEQWSSSSEDHYP